MCKLDKGNWQGDNLEGIKRPELNSDSSEEGEEDDEYSVKLSMEPKSAKEWYQPLCLPMDRAFESKYLYQYLAKNSSRRVTPKEKVYMFLEHPSGWMGFLYHMVV